MSAKIKISVVFFVTIILSMIIRTALSANTVDASQFEYICENGNAIITKYNGTESQITIPSEIDGYPVTATKGAFSGNQTVEKIVVSEGIVEIGDDTFNGCTNLKSIVLPESVTLLGSYAFAHCEIEKLTLTGNNVSIDEGCFHFCEELVYIKSHADKLSIGNYAFFNSGIRVIITDIAPEHSFYSFNKNCYYTDDILGTFTLSHDITTEFYEYVHSLSLIENVLNAILLVMVIILIFMLICNFVGFILILMGKNKVFSYQKFSQNCMNCIANETELLPYIHYKKISFPIDKIKPILIFIGVILYFGLLAYICFSWDLNVENSVWVHLLQAAVVILGGIAITVLLVFIIFKTNCFISERKFEKGKSDKPHIRIRRISRKRGNYVK